MTTKKKYFLQFDFWNEDIDKYFYCVVDSDLNEISLPDLCRKAVRENFPEIGSEDVNIKVNAFNNIDI